MNLKFSFQKSHFVAVALVFSIVSCKKDIDVQPVMNKQSLLLDLPLAANDARQDPKVLLGSKIYTDLNLSVSDGPTQLMVQSCESCHSGGQGFAGFGNKTATVNKNGNTRRFIGGFAEGAFAGRFGGRTPPSAAYATFSPKLYRPDMHDGLPNTEDEFFGGLFWDGRATGHTLGSPAAEQAQGPFLSDMEQNHPSPLAVLKKIEQNLDRYYTLDRNNPLSTKTLWEEVWGTPLMVSDLSENDPKVKEEYNRLGHSIAAFEASNLVNTFSSKYDTYLNNNKNNKLLTKDELKGMGIFQKNCSSCHTTEKKKGGTNPLFTDYGYDNIGVPPTTVHPTWGTLSVDLGLGAFLASSGNSAWLPYAEGAKGKFKTPTVRNVAKGELMSNGSPNRTYMHNGSLTSLEEVVHFYNTRSVKGEGWSKTAPKGSDPRKKSTTGFKVWPAAEYAATFNGEVGKMGMKTEEELQVVAFLRTLTDN
jgi:cytochrome c peroxidase